MKQVISQPRATMIVWGLVMALGAGAIAWAVWHARAGTDGDALPKPGNSMASLADPQLPDPAIDAHRLAAARTLSADELGAGCAHSDLAAGRPAPVVAADKQRAHYCPGEPGPDASLAPAGVDKVKLAIRGFYMPSFGYPEAEIKVAIQSPTAGVLEFSEYDMPPGWDSRQAALTPRDIADILAALKQAQFWRLPFNAHNDAADGEPVLVEAAFPGWRHAAVQNGAMNIDAGILATTLKDIAIRRTKDRPLSWWK